MLDEMKSFKITKQKQSDDTLETDLYPVLYASVKQTI